MTELDFDLEFETDILSRCLVDKEYLQEASIVLKSHHFSTQELSWCWETINAVWSKNKELTKKKIFVLRTRKLHDDVKLDYLRIISDLYKRKPESPKTVLDELKKFILFVNAQKTLENALTKIEKNDIDGAYNEFASAVKKKEISNEYKSVDWFGEFLDRQKNRKQERILREEHPELIKRIPTGIKKIDKIMSGGIQKNELGLVMATTSQGKSSLLTYFTYEALIRKYKVVYFTFEMTVEQVATRQDAIWLKLNYEKFKNYDFDQKDMIYIKNKLIKSRKRFRNPLKIASYKMGYPNVNSIIKILDDYKEEGFVPDLLIIDSPDHMRSIERYKEMRLEQKAIYQDCKALAEKYPIWVSVHAGREWRNKIATSEAAGESYDKSKIADIVITLNTPDKKSRTTKMPFDEFDDEEPMIEPGHRFIELYLAKYRDGEARISIPIDANFKQYIFTEIV